MPPDNALSFMAIGREFHVLVASIIQSNGIPTLNRKSNKTAYSVLQSQPATTSMKTRPKEVSIIGHMSALNLCTVYFG